MGWYFKITNNLQNRWKDKELCCLLQKFVLLIYDSSEYRIWCIRMSLDYTLTFTAIGVAIELIMYVVIEKIMKYIYQIDVVKYWEVLMRHRFGYVLYFIFILQHVATDVMIAKLINV